MNTRTRRIAINVGAAFVPGMNAVVAGAARHPPGRRPVRVSGGYRNADYIRAGGPMTVLVLALAVGTVWLQFD
jgi:hypothetical protein